MSEEAQEKPVEAIFLGSSQLSQPDQRERRRVYHEELERVLNVFKQVEKGEGGREERRKG